jgi:ribonucleotide reductase alpha subunit
MRRGCFPGGRILANAGAGEYSSETTLINCVVGSNIHDSLLAILKVNEENGLTLKTGAGIGFCFSFIRPQHAYVSGVNATTSGPLSFADIFDKTCSTIRSAGGRRGSMMLTFHVFHPDILEVIKVKREKGRLRQFNISILGDDEFIHAVKNDKEWKLYFPLHKKDVNRNAEIVYKYWPISDPDYTLNEKGETVCKVYNTIPARIIWKAIMDSNYSFAEPGFIFIDRINNTNNLYFCEQIVATNPCGEQPLPQNGSCWTGDMRINTNYGLIKTEEAFELSKTKPLQIAVDSMFTGELNTTLKDCQIIENGTRPIYEIEFNNGQLINSTNDHQIYTETGWKEVKDLENDDICYSQSFEINNLPYKLVNDFDIGRIRYVLDQHIINNYAYEINKFDSLIIFSYFCTYIFAFKRRTNSREGSSVGVYVFSCWNNSDNI